MKKEQYLLVPEFVSQYDQSVSGRYREQFEHIIKIGYLLGASDVHIEPVDFDLEHSGKISNIRYRVDGELDNFVFNISETARNSPFSYLTMYHFPAFERAVKTAVNKDPNIKELPQDSNYAFSFSDEENTKQNVRLRISFLPTATTTVKNESEIGGDPLDSIVCRIIRDDVSSIRKIQDLGLIPKDLDRLLKYLDAEKGSVITSGPTGSGKSSTSHSFVGYKVSPKKAIMTLEDPVEYRNPALIQCSIKPHLGFGWAEGIKALMRQDPDIIMVGEVRDKESASLFIEACLTGHMGLSTIHTKSAVGVYNRFIQMGVPAYQVTSGIGVAVAQRLVLRLCPHCFLPVSKTEQEVATRYFHETFGEFDFSSLSGYDVAKMYGLDTKIGKEKFGFEGNMEEAAQLIEDDMFGPIRSILHSVATSDNDLRNKSEQIDIENKKIYTTILEIFLASLRRRNPDGCENCYYKGTRGRVPMFEFVYCDKDIQNAILTNVASEVMDDMIKKKNVFTLERYGIMGLTRSEIDLAEFVSIRTSSEI